MSEREVIYVLDTSALISDFKAINAFPHQEVVIPSIVLQELDGLKKRQDENGRSARENIRLLEELRCSGKGSLKTGIALENGSKLRVVSLKKRRKTMTNDNIIIAVAAEIQATSPEKRVIVVSQDVNLRVMADVDGLEAIPYNHGELKLEIKDEIYSGVTDMIIAEPQMAFLAENGFLDIDKGLFPNQCVYARLSADGIPMLCVYKRNEKTSRLVSINKKQKMFKIAPKNNEQRLAASLLMDNEISLVTLMGTSGCGKTLLAVAAALELVINRGDYHKIIVTKPNVPVGREIGFFPGTKDEKLDPWMGSVWDALRFIFNDDEDKIQQLINSKALEFEAVSLFRGRSLPNTILIVDEAQNLNKLEAKTIVTRAGENTKIILTSDVKQIDSPYLDILTNGATHVVEMGKTYNGAGHVTLQQGERSGLSAWAAENL